MNQTKLISHRFMHNTAFQGITYISIAVSNLLVSVFIGHLAGPEKLGSFAFAITITLLGAFLSDFGIGLLLIRLIARIRDQHQQIKKVFQNALGIGVVLATSLVLGIYLLAPHVSNSAETNVGIRIIALGLALSGLTKIIRAVFYAEEKMHYETIFTVIQELVYLCLIIATLLMKAPFVMVFWSYSISRMLGLILALTLYSREFGKFAISYEWVIWQTLLQKSWPFAANTLLTVVYIRSDIVLLGILQDDLAVGIYEAGMSIAIRVNVIARMMTNSILPSLARAYQSSLKDFNSIVNDMLRYLLLLSAPVVITFSVMSTTIIRILYGAKFKSAILIFSLLSFLIPIRFASNVFAAALTSSDAQKRRTFAVFLASIVNVLLNLVLIPRYSYWGTVASTIFTEFCLFIFLALLLKARVELSLQIQGLGIFFITSIIIALFVLLLKNHWYDVWITVTAVGIYCLIIWHFVLTLPEQNNFRLYSSRLLSTIFNFNKIRKIFK